jgi:hypothetical protein
VLRKRFVVPLIEFAIALTMIISFTPAHAAEFTADIVITVPRDDYVYSLHVKDNMYRLQKIKGPMNVPPYPSIVNSDTGVTWGLNPQLKQYVEMNDIKKTMLANPLVGWAMTRNGMTEKRGPVETVSGYECETRLYTAKGESKPAAKVWISKKFNQIIREERFAMNENAVMELKNIKEGPVNPDLFKIPAGYTKFEIPTETSEAVSKKKEELQRPKVETFEVKTGSGRGRSLDPERRIMITATGDNPEGTVSVGIVTVQDENHAEIKSERFKIGNNESRTWEIPAEKRPRSLSLRVEGPDCLQGRANC